MTRVVHFEIEADEPQRAISFYAGVFHWRFSKWDGPQDYWYIETGASDRRGIDGGLIPRRDPVHGGGANAWVCTVEVASLDDALQAIRRHGGTVREGDVTIPAVGRLAYCNDSEGNRFSVIEYRRGETEAHDA